MNKYIFREIINDKWAVWYLEFPKKKGNKIGCYKIIDLYSGTREKRFAFRYLPRKDQTQEQSDALIISNSIRHFYQDRRVVFNHNNIEVAEILD